MMNSEWKSAVDAGQACLSDVTVLSCSSVNLYETDADFAAKCQSDDIKGCAIVDNAGNDFTVGGVIGKLTATNTDEVTYTVVDGVLIKHIDRHITYTCEMVTVIYTKVELKTSLGTTTRQAEMSGSDTTRWDSPSERTIAALPSRKGVKPW